MLGLACLSVAENLGESGLTEWFTANQFHVELLGAPPTTENWFTKSLTHESGFRVSCVISGLMSDLRSRQGAVPWPVVVVALSVRHWFVIGPLSHLASRSTIISTVYGALRAPL